MDATVLLLREGKWEPASLLPYEKESVLRNLLAESPELIPNNGGAAAVTEFPIPGRGKVDVMSVDESGLLTLVECKLSKNSESRRAVVGQILAYASGLQGMSYDDFERYFMIRSESTSSLAEIVKDRAAGEFEAAEFSAIVEQSLKSGKFQLVMALDSITPELRAIIEYLSAHLSDTVTVMALELSKLSHGDLELLVPRTYGLELAEAKPDAPAAKSLQDINSAVSDIGDANSREILIDMIAHWSQFGRNFKPGTAFPSGGFYYSVDGKVVSVWSLYLKSGFPQIVLNFKSVGNVSKDRAKKMLSRVQESSYLSKVLPASGEDLGPQKRISLDAVPDGDEVRSALLGALTIAAESLAQD